MAVTITLAQVAADRRLGDGTNDPEEPVKGILERHLATATALVEDRAPNAPTAVQNTAASLIVGYLYDAPVADGTRYANAVANSGAAAVLARYRNLRVAIVDPDATQPQTAATAQVVAGQIAAGSLPAALTYSGLSVTIALTQADHKVLLELTGQLTASRVVLTGNTARLVIRRGDTDVLDVSQTAAVRIGTRNMEVDLRGLDMPDTHDPVEYQLWWQDAQETFSVSHALVLSATEVD